MYRVEWIQAALDDLTSLWVQADSALRQAITGATHALDQQLQSDPFLHSESRGGDERVAFVYPLGAQIEVDWQRKIVWVLAVWRFRRRGE
jgi:hypothetical protein